MTQLAPPESLSNFDESSRTRAIQDAFNANRSKMTMVLARELGVSEADVVRALPDGLSIELDVTRWEALLRSFEALEGVHVISSNGAVTLECFGSFGNFSTWGEFFNVQTKSLDMHVRYKELAAAFAVQKPGHMDGVNTLSFQLFDRRGNSAFKVFLTFGSKPPTPERVAQWQSIVDQFRKAEATI